MNPSLLSASSRLGQDTARDFYHQSGTPHGGFGENPPLPEGSCSIFNGEHVNTVDLVIGWFTGGIDTSTSSLVLEGRSSEYLRQRPCRQTDVRLSPEEPMETAAAENCKAPTK